MGLTPEQIELRRKGITATDATKITGCNPYGSAVDVVLDKLGDPLPFVETDRVKWGNILEPVVRDDFAKRHRLAVDLPGTLTHSNGWAMATPDGICLDQSGPIAGLEIKTHSFRMGHHYDDSEADGIPQWVYMQSAWNLYVARDVYGPQVDRWHVVSFIDGLPTDYVVEHDAEIEAAMVEKCEAFWKRHIVDREPLDPDGSESFDRFITRKYPRNVEAIREATSDEADAIATLKAARENQREADKLVEVASQRVKLAIGETDGLTFNIGDGDDKITWKASKDSEFVDWKTVAKVFGAHVPDDVKENTVAEFTRTREGSRRFVTPRRWGMK